MNSKFKFGTGHLLIGISLAASVVSAGLNIWHSLNIMWAIPIILMAEGTRALLPFAAVRRGWNKQLKVIFGAVVALCLITSTAFLADKFAEVLKDRAQQQTVLVQKGIKITDLKAEIVAMTEKLSSETLLDMAKAEAQNKGCADRCMKLKERAGKAKVREQKEADLKSLETQTETAKVEVSGLGWLLGSITGLGDETGSALSMIFIAAVILYTLDLLTYLSITGATWVREDNEAAQLAQFGVGEKTEPKVKADGTVKVRKEDAYREIVSMLMGKHEHSMITSERQLAQVLGVAKSTLNGWLKEWNASGRLVVLEKSKHRKVVSLRKAA
jgi:hypothetical protein